MSTFNPNCGPRSRDVGFEGGVGHVNIETDIRRENGDCFASFIVFVFTITRLDGQVHCSRQGIMLPFQADDQSVGIVPFAHSAAPHPLKTMAIAPFHAGGGVGAARDRAK